MIVQVESVNVLDGLENIVILDVREDDLGFSVNRIARVLAWNFRTQTPLATQKPANVNANPATKDRNVTNENAMRSNTAQIAPKRVPVSERIL